MKKETIGAIVTILVAVGTKVLEELSKKEKKNARRK